MKVRVRVKKKVWRGRRRMGLRELGGRARVREMFWVILLEVMVVEVGEDRDQDKVNRRLLVVWVDIVLNRIDRESNLRACMFVYRQFTLDLYEGIGRNLV
jgi:hypothetical protein